MSDFAIRAEGIGKMYRIGGTKETYPRLSEAVMDFVLSPIRRLRNLGDLHPGGENFWALQDISFELHQGDTLGVIGSNGAGKSTLLKIASRITAPTTGIMELQGRVGSLLEVGTGFHPELTGRENTFLNGAILGMTRREIQAKFDEIVDFAEIGKFIDTPVKRYSSGMYTRLAFAVAAHLEPEILIVDEVLAVGDVAFQRKCLGKMSDVADSGRTVLFVSHNMNAVRQLCRQAIWLQDGRIIATGDADSVVAEYLQENTVGAAENVWENMEDAPGSDAIRVRRAAVRPTDPDHDGVMTMTTPLTIEFEYWNLKPNAELSLSVHVFQQREGVRLFQTMPVHETQWFGKPHPVGLYRTRINIPGHLLNTGVHRVEVRFLENMKESLYTDENILSFEVAQAPEAYGQSSYSRRWKGVIHPKLDWETALLDPLPEAQP